LLLSFSSVGLLPCSPPSSFLLAVLPADGFPLGFFFFSFSRKPNWLSSPLPVDVQLAVLRHQGAAFFSSKFFGQCGLLRSPYPPPGSQIGLFFISLFTASDPVPFSLPLPYFSYVLQSCNSFFDFRASPSLNSFLPQLGWPFPFYSSPLRVARFFLLSQFPFGTPNKAQLFAHALFYFVPLFMWTFFPPPLISVLLDWLLSGNRPRMFFPPLP